MHNIDPNEMDALFREGAERHEFQYNENSWALMEAKLDRKERNKKLLFWFTAVAAVLLLSILAYTQFKNVDDSTTAAIVEKTQVNQRTVQESKEVYSEDKAKATTDDAFEKNASILENQISEERQNESAETEIYLNDQKLDGQRLYVNENTSIDETAQEKIFNPSNSELGEVNILQNDDSNNVITSEPTSGEVYNVLESQIEKEVDERPLFVISNVTRNYTNNISSKESNTLLLEDTEFTNPPIISDAIGGRFILSTFGGLEYSSVGITSDVQSGYRFGGKIGYQFGGHWQLDAGFAYSHKQYGSKGDAYQLEGGWDAEVGAMPMWMDAKCDVFEIPVEVTYYLKNFKEDGFFFNAGVSSYFLDSEWYGFKYSPEVMNDPAMQEKLIDEITTRSVDNPNSNVRFVEPGRHITGVGRLSVGYQKILSNHTSVEIAPYLQIPLSGFGNGKVDLYSSGIQVGFRFH